MASEEKYLPVLKFLSNEVLTFALGLVAIFTFFIIYIASLPVFALRFLISKVARVVHSDFGNILNAQGNLFVSELSLPTAPRCAIVVPIVVEGHLTEKEVLTRFNAMINTKDKETENYKYPEFKQYIDIWYGFAFWRNDPQFDIQYHVHFHETKSNTVIDKDVSTLVEDLLNKPFSRKRSPWEVFIVNNYTDPELPPGDKTVIMMRFHHSIADGYSILYAIIEGLLQAPISSVPLPSPNYVKRGMWNRFWFSVTFPFRLVHDISHYFAKGLRKNPWNVPDEKKMWKQVYGKSRLVSIEQIKEIKNYLDVSFTSVLLAAISAGVSQAITAADKGKHELSDHLQRISCFIPIPLPGHPTSLRNHVTGAQIDLPLEGSLDPVSRVKECELLLQQQRNSTIPTLLIFLARTIGLHFSSICSKLTSNRVNPIGLTNFPAGNTDIKIGFEDKKVLNVDLAVGALLGISGVAFMSISYGKHIRFAATAENSILSRSDVNQLLGYITKEVAVLYEIVCNRQENKTRCK